MITFPPDLIDEALAAAQLACLAHHGQLRKGKPHPYFIHPLRVAHRVLAPSVPSKAQRRTMVLAALLHDVLEDTKTPRTEIVERFGEAVAAVVSELTQDKALPKAERKRKMVDGCGQYSLEARVVKLADRWDNLLDMAGMTPEFHIEYSAEARAMVANMRGTWPEAEAAILDICARYGQQGPGR